MRVCVSTLLAVLLAIQPIQAAVTDFARNSASAVGGATTFPSLSVSPSGGSNCYAVVVARWESAATISGSITFDGNNMTQLARQTNDSNLSMEVWTYDMAACSGTYAVAGTLSASSNGRCIGVTVFDDTSTLGSAATAAGSSTTPSLSIASGSAGGVVFAGLGSRFPAASLTANDTLSWEVDDGGNDVYCGLAFIAGASGTVDWTMGGSANWYVTGSSLTDDTGGGGSGGTATGSMLRFGVGR